MSRTQERPSLLYGLIAVSILVAAYLLVQPNGAIASVGKEPVDNQAKPKVAASTNAVVVPALTMEDVEDDGGTNSLDVPIAGTNFRNPDAPPAPDIPNNMAFNDGGQLVRSESPPPQDREFAQDNEVHGAE